MADYAGGHGAALWGREESGIDGDVERSASVLYRYDEKRLAKAGRFYRLYTVADNIKKKSTVFFVTFYFLFITGENDILLA